MESEPVADKLSPLEELYPFLHGKEQDEQLQSASLLESVRQKSEDSASVKRTFFEKNAANVIASAKAIASVYRNGGQIFAMGNGGSSCDASHFAVEFQHPVTTGRPALPAMNLVMDTAILSAIGNDVGIEHVFLRQIEAHAKSQDGLVGFSTSGNSANLIAAFEKAKQMDLVTIGLAGGDGGEMKTSAHVDHCLVVETDSIHRVQEVHVTIYHILWDLVHTLLADDRGKQTTFEKVSKG